jgi:hypothetical protein
LGLPANTKARKSLSVRPATAALRMGKNGKGGQAKVVSQPRKQPPDVDDPGRIGNESKGAATAVLTPVPPVLSPITSTPTPTPTTHASSPPSHSPPPSNLEVLLRYNHYKKPCALRDGCITVAARLVLSFFLVVCRQAAQTNARRTAQPFPGACRQACGTNQCTSHCSAFSWCL